LIGQLLSGIAYLIGWAMLSAGCATVCPSGWETSTTVGHNALFGQTIEASVTLSGDIGTECKPD
jgi:hypothetical protein